MDFDEVLEACKKMQVGDQQTFVTAVVWGLPQARQLANQLEEDFPERTVMIVRRGLQLTVSMLSEDDELIISS